MRTHESKHCGSCFYRDLQSQCSNCEATLSLPTKWIDRSIYIDNGIKIPIEDTVKDTTAYSVFANLERRLQVDAAPYTAIPAPKVALGIKFDSKKPRWSLLPWKQVEEVVDVLTYGSEKYADDNWKIVPNAPSRYLDATLRHITAWVHGERTDQETGRSHLAHAICCLLFMMWHSERSERTTKE